jgi:inorganic pyrophosphatase
MDFWEKLDNLIATIPLVIDRPKGSAHPRYSELIYPLDYGYLEGTTAGDGDGIDVWRGSLGDNRLVAVICAVDGVKLDAEVKLIIGCTENEIRIIERFHNNDRQSGMVIRRNN